VSTSLETLALIIHQMALDLRELGFRPSYVVVVNPEFPPSGNWGVPEIRVGGDSAETVVIKVIPPTAEPWVGFFACESRGLLVGVYDCPNPEHLLVVTGIDAYLVRVNQPHDMQELPVHPVTAVDRPSGTDLVVVGSFTELAAIDSLGLRWVTERLFKDDLKLATGPPGKVYVQGSLADPSIDPEVLTIDSATGKVIAGERYSSRSPDRPRWHRDGS
jgi:hypothetical protein